MNKKLNMLFGSLLFFTIGILVVSDVNSDGIIRGIHVRDSVKITWDTAISLTSGKTDSLVGIVISKEAGTDGKMMCMVEYVFDGKIQHTLISENSSDIELLHGRKSDIDSSAVNALRRKPLERATKVPEDYPRTIIPLGNMLVGSFYHEYEKGSPFLMFRVSKSDGYGEVFRICIQPLVTKKGLSEVIYSYGEPNRDKADNTNWVKVQYMAKEKYNRFMGVVKRFQIRPLPNKEFVGPKNTYDWHGAVVAVFGNSIRDPGSFLHALDLIAYGHSAYIDIGILGKKDSGESVMHSEQVGVYDGFAMPNGTLVGEVGGE